MLAENRIVRTASVLLGATLAAWSAQALAARRADFVLDATTGRTLYARHADEKRYPASLTKMMTLYLLFGELERKHVTLDTPFHVSAHAAAQAPVKLWMKAGDTITAGDAIRAIVTLSANDAAVTIAENLSGSEAAFAQRMTHTAHRLGMADTVFRTASGLPAAGQYTTAHDMALLGAALRARFPQYYGFFHTTRFVFHGHVYRDHDHVLHEFRHVDGIKTGYTDASGFNIVTSYRRNGRKMIVVVMGGPTWRARDSRDAALIRRYAGKLQRGSGTFESLMAGIRRAEAVAWPPEAKPVEVASAAGDAAGAAFNVRRADDVSIRVGALPSRQAAQIVLAATEPVVEPMLDGAHPLTRRVARDGKTFFRAVYAGFDDVDSAQQACSALKRHHFPCYAVVRPAAD